jgi:purine-binding chemotaxis protein CheW
VRMPRMPSFLDGVIYLRDAIVPVVDLRKRMEVPARAPTTETRYVIVLIDDERVALLVDAVLEVAHLRGEDLAAPPAFFRGVSAEYLQGLAKVGERVIIVLKIARILTSEERIALLRADLGAEPLAEPAGEPGFVTTVEQDLAPTRRKRK